MGQLRHLVGDIFDIGARFQLATDFALEPFESAGKPRHRLRQFFEHRAVVARHGDRRRLHRGLGGRARALPRADLRNSGLDTVARAERHCRILETGNLSLH